MVCHHPSSVCLFVVVVRIKQSAKQILKLILIFFIDNSHEISGLIFSKKKKYHQVSAVVMINTLTMALLVLDMLCLCKKRSSRSVEEAILHFTTCWCL